MVALVDPLGDLGVPDQVTATFPYEEVGLPHNRARDASELHDGLEPALVDNRCAGLDRCPSSMKPLFPGPFTKVHHLRESLQVPLLMAQAQPPQHLSIRGGRVLLQSLVPQVDTQFAPRGSKEGVEV
jgi:hypothetical protein